MFHYVAAQLLERLLPFIFGLLASLWCHTSGNSDSTLLVTDSSIDIRIDIAAPANMVMSNVIQRHANPSMMGSSTGPLTGPTGLNSEARAQCRSVVASLIASEPLLDVRLANMSLETDVERVPCEICSDGRKDAGY